MVRRPCARRVAQRSAARSRDGEGAALGGVQPHDGSRGPDARRNRLHLGTRYPSVVQALALRRIVFRSAAVSSRTSRAAGRLLIARERESFEIRYLLSTAGVRRAEARRALSRTDRRSGGGRPPRL